MSQPVAELRAELTPLIVSTIEWLLIAIVVVANRIDKHAAAIWGAGKDIATNTVQIWQLQKTNAVAGQILVLVVDRSAFPSGYERAIQATASRLLDRLSPADAVGLVQIPGPIVDVTRDHARVADALKSIVGNRPTRATRHTVSWDEAIAFERGQKFIKAAVYARECRSGEASCSQDVDLAAAEHARARALAHMAVRVARARRRLRAQIAERDRV